MSSSVTANARDEQQESFSFEEARDHTHDQHQSNEQGNMSENPHSGKPCMQLKGSLVPMTVLELNYFDESQFNLDLSAKISQAPDFFENLPVVIGLEKFDTSSHLPITQLVSACQARSIKIVAIRGGSEQLQMEARQAGLGILPKQKERSVDTAAAAISEPKPSERPAETRTVTETKTETVEVLKTVVQKERQVSKIVHHPIRSGQQVYASDGDLVVLASVSAGAEILADGNIHVYGALRGRALAGVKGDASARIFCQSLEAELVSVAGQYKISEDISKEVSGQAAQVYLDADSLRLKKLEL